ncbi:hypothetical protein SVIO_084000 [Streptomyces violaceusniger]|uniref:Uncharacterized protein n=1 Tax=Streptomyces violaceusniger TaxID=68280 RepID=A0A4D4LH43_STRVO|nr:hypothetical protein SVIO_084000 [Streptomyces violaceusniger]
MTRHTTHVGSGGAGGVRHGNLPRTALTALAPSVWGTTYVVTTELLPEGHPLFAGSCGRCPPA